jgi:predicted Zn-dependent protease
MIRLGIVLLLVSSAGCIWALSSEPTSDQTRRSTKRSKATRDAVKRDNPPKDNVEKEDRGADRREKETSGDTRKEATAPVKRATKSSERGDNGWIPSSAREVTLASALPRKAKASSGCREQASLVSLAKDMAQGFDRELREALKMSDAEESRLGDRFEREILREMASTLNRPEDVRRYKSYLDSLLARLIPHAKRGALRYRLHIKRDDAFNAFAMPGGVMVVHTGLLDEVLDESELMAVLGHEVAHVELRHTVASYQLAKTVLGSSDDEAAILAHMLRTPISSGNELEADDYGITLSAKAQWDPTAAMRLWKRMGARHGGGGSPTDIIGGLFEALDELVQTHPPGQTRCFRAMQTAARLRRSLPFDRYYRGKSNLKTRTPGPKKPF